MAPHNDDDHAALMVHLSYLKDGVDECRALLKAQNGRVSRAETSIAVLNDRANEAKNWGAGAGAAAGGFTGVVLWVFSKLWGGQ